MNAETQERGSPILLERFTSRDERCDYVDGRGRCTSTVTEWVPHFVEDGDQGGFYCLWHGLRAAAGFALIEALAVIDEES